jgi:hypothetical protein
MGMATPAKRPVIAEAKSTFFHMSLLRYLGSAPPQGSTGLLEHCVKNLAGLGLVEDL